jgi:hypothetical protein
VRPRPEEAPSIKPAHDRCVMITSVHRSVYLSGLTLHTKFENVNRLV